MCNSLALGCLGLHQRLWQFLGLCWCLALQELQPWLFCAGLGRAVGQGQMEGAVAGRGARADPAFT